MEAWRVGLFNLSILWEGFSLFLSVSHTKRNQTHGMLKFGFFKKKYILFVYVSKFWEEKSESDINP